MIENRPMGSAVGVINKRSSVALSELLGQRSWRVLLKAAMSNGDQEGAATDGQMVGYAAKMLLKLKRRRVKEAIRSRQAGRDGFAGLRAHWSRERRYWRARTKGGLGGDKAGPNNRSR